MNRPFEWLDPWEQVEEGTAAGLDRRLRLELAPGHPMFGVPAVAVARRCDCDDVLFATTDGSRRVAVVHLTWTSHTPERPPWPMTVVYAAFAVWMSEGMTVDHAGRHS